MAERSYPTSEARGNGLEEIPHARKQGWRSRGAIPRLRSGVVPERRHPTSEARGGGQKEQPHAQGQGTDREEQPYIQGVVAAQVQEGLEELSHAEGQEGQWQEDTPHSR